MQMSQMGRQRRGGYVRVRVLAAAAVLGFTAIRVSAVLNAQQSPAPQSTFRTGVDVVQVDVSVLDRERNPVSGLTAADFTMRVDGKPVSIAAFTPVNLAPRVPRAPRPRHGRGMSRPTWPRAMCRAKGGWW